MQYYLYCFIGLKHIVYQRVSGPDFRGVLTDPVLVTQIIRFGSVTFFRDFRCFMVFFTR